MPIRKKGDLIIRRFRASDLNPIKQIIENLHPEWFTEEALINIPRDIQFARCYVAEMNGGIVGFISVHSHDGKPMIGWMGVDLNLRGEGIGRQMLRKVEEDLEDYGYKDLRVETVGECTPVYKPYETTLKFYEAAGFEIEKRGRLRNDLGYKWRYSTLKKALSSR